MTAKEALLERVESMSEQEAAELLDRLDWEATEFEVLTDEELARVQRGQGQLQRGESIDGEELFRQLKL